MCQNISVTCKSPTPLSRAARSSTWTKPPIKKTQSSSPLKPLHISKKKKKPAGSGGKIVPMAAEKAVMVIGVDDSEYATYALEWTLDHFFSSTANPPFKLVVVYAKPFPDVFVGVGGPGMIVGSAGSYQFLNEDLKKKAAMIIATARGIFESKAVISDVKFEVEEGDARNVLCQAVEKHRASFLVVGSHGDGAVKRAFLGSVSDYCAHQASCTVMIVKKPKINK